jgi:hypothetical protein
MKPLFLFSLACVALPAALAADLQAHYAQQGELIVAQIASAPFPHSQRADGHKYKQEFYSVKEHYSDSTVAIFIPKDFRETGRNDFIVHFHGWGNHVERVLDQYQLIEQLVESRRNAILVVPQGPRDASDSFGGKLEDTNGFKVFMKETVETLRQKSGLKNKDFTTGRIVLSGHSGGYQVISSILDRGGLGNQVAEVWLFDALYAQTEKFLAWFDKSHGRLLNIYTERGGTKTRTEQMMATLKQRGTPFFSGKDSEAKSKDLQSNQLIFLFTDLPHNDVLAKHQTFRDFLKTSCFGELTESR